MFLRFNNSRTFRLFPPGGLFAIPRFRSARPAALLLVAALLFALVLAPPVAAKQAATRGLGVVSVETERGETVELYKGSHALLIGVSDYTAGWPDLEAIPDELDMLEEALVEKGFSVTRVSDPDGAQLEQAFERFIDKYGYEPENRLLFFYSGHGYTRKIGKRQKGYLVPADAPSPEKDEKGFARVSLNMSKVLTWAREIEAKHALFLFDSCFSGTIFKTRALPTPRHITAKTSKPVRQFITAGSAGEEVPARSIFLPTFIRAIQGEGDLNHDGYVTASELGQHLNEKVMSYNGGQTPQYGKIKDPDLDEGDFVFVTPQTARGQERPEQNALLNPPGAGGAAGQAQPLDGEQELWLAVKGSDDPGDYQAYLEEYPQGRFAAVARLKLKKLGRAAQQKAPAKKKDPGADKRWAAIRNSRDIVDFMVFLKQYPDSEQAPLARRKLGRLTK